MEFEPMIIEGCAGIFVKTAEVNPLDAIETVHDYCRSFRQCGDCPLNNGVRGCMINDPYKWDMDTVNRKLKDE